MANIKFSDFTVGNTEGDIDFVVGYKGASNIQISPTNLLASALGNYLPLAGGTMNAGSSVLFPDNSFLRFGTSADATIYHDTINTYFKNFTGNLILQNNKDNADIVFQSDDGIGGVATYFYLDGSLASSPYVYTRFPDNSVIFLGDGGDAAIFHDGTDTRIKNETGDLFISQFANDKDIVFRSDDGSGGIAEYFKLDGSAQLINVSASNGMQFNDNIRIKVGSGTGGDLRIYHNATNSIIENVTGDLVIQNNLDDKDIIFKSDDGSGGVTNYIQIDGSELRTTFNKTIRLNDAIAAQFGGSNGMQIYHNNSNSVIQNITGNLTIRNDANDKDIEFACDDGSGGVTPYFKCKGDETITQFVQNTNHQDNAKATFGTGLDLEIYHDTSNSYVTAKGTGQLIIQNTTDDADILFKSDDGSGGTTEYFKLDGSAVFTRFSKDARFSNSVKIELGDSGDFNMSHNGTDATLQNFTGNFNIVNKANDSDIVFQSDDGSGGVTTYLRLDGSSKRLDIPDSIPLCFGAGDDLQIQHNGSTSYIQNFTGNLIIENNLDDGDIIFKSDDGSGGTTEYFRLDGGDGINYFFKDVKFLDDGKIKFGTGSDLQIYHDGSNSHIKDTGTGFLIIEADAALVLQNAGGEPYLQAISNGAVQLYFDNSKKLETTSTGVKISGVSEYADNTAAIAAGLTTGDLYRTGDLLKIVH